MDEFSPGMGCMSCAKGKFLQAHPFSYPLWAQPKDPIFNKDTAVGMGSEVHKHVGWAPPTSGPEDLPDAGHAWPSISPAFPQVWPQDLPM